MAVPLETVSAFAAEPASAYVRANLMDPVSACVPANLMATPMACRSAHPTAKCSAVYRRRSYRPDWIREASTCRRPRRLRMRSMQ